jgi:hypothetical protein
MNPLAADSAPKAKRLNIPRYRVFFLLLVLFAESSVWAADPSRHIYIGCSSKVLHHPNVALKGPIADSQMASVRGRDGVLECSGDTFFLPQNL